MSGAAAWLFAANGVAAVTGSTLNTPQLLIGAAVCAGSALLPDIDSPSSTVARSLGPLTQGLAHIVSSVSAVIFNATATPKDGRRTGGHRTVTHTLLGAIAAGVAVSALTATVGTWAVVGVLFFTLSLALRGLMADWAAKEGWIGVSAVAAALTAWAYTGMGGQSFWWLGSAVTAGMLLHDLGDMITKEGCPLLWPLVWRGKTWWEFAPPGFLRIRAGGAVEYGLLLPTLVVATVLGVGWVYDPQLVRSILS